MLRETWSHRSLLWALTYRQYQLRYRQSAAGVLWAFVAPIATLVTATIVFHGVANVDTGSVPYPLFAMAALVPWSFFASCLNFGTQSVTQSGPLVTLFAFPRIVLPLSMIGTAFVDLVISAMVFLAYSVAIGQHLPVTVWWFPIVLLLEVALTVGICSLAAAVNVFARDVKLVIPTALQVWLLLTPVMYPLSAVPSAVRWLYLANPMTGIVESFRRILVYGQPPSLLLLAPTLLGIAFFVSVGLWYFGVTERRFADAL